ncbi:MAG TPA: tryptophan synthase subunit alpha [Pirellulales bacterium]|nr:tryptophan synthase subunit alpha [Pirellulales bacterium]
MSAIDTLFQQLRREKRKALMPFVTAGDPDLDFTAAVLKAMVERGANLCELGIPYSDPIADGPVIQASYTRALAHKIKLAQIFEMGRRRLPTLAAPVVTMASYAIIFRHGLRQYIADAQAAGFAGTIVPDLLVEEAGEMSRLCRDADFSLIQLITPTTPRDRALQIAESSTGFVYYVSITGITGERTELPAELVDSVSWLRERTPLPVCIGFGISTPEHLKRLAPVADGLIVGSAIVRRMAGANQGNRDEVLRGIGDFVAQLVAALK